MYYQGMLKIDPSQLTKIEKVRPEKAFRKFLYFVSRGIVADKIENETFTAISILQQLNKVFRSLGITNIIRLSQDDLDFYLDEHGKADDLQDAIEKYDLETNEALSIMFKTLYMVLEHNDKNSSFNYLLEIRINRTHQVSDFPIEIKINGLLKEFTLQEGQSADNLKEKMTKLFNSQQAYDAFTETKKLEFSQFVDNLSFTLKKHIQVDDIKTSNKTAIVVPKKKVRNKEEYQPNRYADDPVYHGYYGYTDVLLYTMLWSDMCHDHSINVHDTSLIADDGMLIGDVGEQGIDTGSSNIFDTDQPFDDRMSSASEELSSGEQFDGSTDSSNDSGSFFDSSDSSSSDSSSDSGCGSSGCSSGCGGGCN